MFESFPGFFVEHDDEFVGACLSQPTPLIVQGPNGPITGPIKSKEDIRKFFKAANKENNMVSDTNKET